MRDHKLRGTTNYSRDKFLRHVIRSVGVFAFLVSASTAFGQRAEDIIFTPEKIKTIPGHGMSQGEYPYDEGGYYRKDWVSVSAKSPERSSTTVRQPIPITSEEHSNFAAKMRIKESTRVQKQIGNKVTPHPTTRTLSNTRTKAKVGNLVTPMTLVMTDTEAKRNGFIGPYSKMRAPVRRSAPPISFTQSTITAKSSISSIYHKVNSGDTLFNISRKYGVTVDALKKANGLTSDLIRVGQSLRLALAQHTLGVPQR